MTNTIQPTIFFSSVKLSFAEYLGVCLEDSQTEHLTSSCVWITFIFYILPISLYVNPANPMAFLITEHARISLEKYAKMYTFYLNKMCKNFALCTLMARHHKNNQSVWLFSV